MKDELSLEKLEEFYNFLQGEVPDGIHCKSPIGSQMTDYQRGFLDGVAECKHSACKLIDALLDDYKREIKRLPDYPYHCFSCVDLWNLCCSIKAIHYERKKIGDIGDWK